MNKAEIINEITNVRKTERFIGDEDANRCKVKAVQGKKRGEISDKAEKNPQKKSKS